MSPCWACGDASTAPAERLAPLPFLRCERCGFCFHDDLDASALETEYAGGNYEAERSETYAGKGLEARRRDARVRLRFVAAHGAGTGRLLDVGAAAGAFVAEAGAAGYRAAGIEPSPETARYGRETLGVDVRTGMVEDTELEAESFDVVTMWHVLEHVREPLPTLERLRGALAPGGIFALEVPNAESAIALGMGAGWPSLEPTVHVGQFGPRSIAALLQRGGFEVAHVGTVSIAAYYGLRERLAPGQLVHQARWGRVVGTLRAAHPTGHELLRAVGRRPQP